MLEGSVQRGGNRLRVNVQLIAAETGTHVWAERFDKPVADLFDMQDEIVSRLANTLNAQLMAVEARRAENTPHPDTMDLYFLGRASLNKGVTLEYLTQAHGFFERALALDPRNVAALVGAAVVDASIGGSFLTDDRMARFAMAEAASTKALSLAPDLASAHLALGAVHILTNRAAEGITDCEQALALDRNSADAHACIGWAKYLLGRGAETEGSYPRGAPAVASRYWCLPLDEFCRYCQVAGWCRRGSGHVVAPEHRCQPQCALHVFQSCHSPGAIGPVG